MRTVAKILFLAVLVALAGCSTMKKDDKGANGENLGPDGNLSQREMRDIDKRAKTFGAKGANGEGFQGGELNDPASRLSKRVIYFEYDASSLQAEDQAVVQAHADYLVAHGDLNITLEGHTDERGSREYNLALGEKRATAVRRQMTLLGVNANQIKTTSFGEERPAEDGHDESAYGRNRRVEIKYEQR